MLISAHSAALSWMMALPPCAQVLDARALFIGFLGFLGSLEFIGFVGFTGFIGFIGLTGFMGLMVFMKREMERRQGREADGVRVLQMFIRFFGAALRTVRTAKEICAAGNFQFINYAKLAGVEHHCVGPHIAWLGSPNPKP